MAPSDSSPMKPEDGLGNGKSQNEIGAVGIQEQIENDQNAKPSSHYASCFNQPGPYSHCGPSDYGGYPSGFSDDSQDYEPTSGVPSEACDGYDYEDMYAEEEAEDKTWDHVNNGCSLKEACDENSHVDGGNNREAESTRVIYVPCPKVGLLVGAVATIRYLQPNFGDRIRILRDSKVDTKCAQRAVEITVTIAQNEFAEQLIEAVLAQENHEEEETEKPSSQKDCEALIEEVRVKEPKSDAATSLRT